MLQTDLSQVAVNLIELLINRNWYFDTFVIDFSLPFLLDANRNLLAEEVSLIKCNKVCLELLSSKLVHIADLAGQGLQIVHDCIEYENNLAEDTSERKDQAASV